MTVSELLRARTGAAHDKIETAFDLDARLASPEAYRELLRTLLGFHTAFAAAIRPHELRPLLAASSVDRAALLREDLGRLGASGDARASGGAMPRFRDPSEAAGGLYVVEGSILGGAVIARIVERRLGYRADTGAAFFVGHGRDTAAAWRRFTAALDASGADPEHAVAGAEHTFATMQGWLCAEPAPAMA